MFKLFSNEDFEEAPEPLTFKEEDMGSVLQGSDFSEEIEDVKISSDIVTEAISLYANQLTVASSSAVDLQRRKMGSVEYLVSVENYKVITDSLSANLGLKRFVPSLEDFSSRYAMKASHEIALEGFVDFIKKIWQKIKDFFHSFFKKVNQFIRRITGANLEIDTYEKYVDAMIRKIKKNKLTLSDNQAKLESRLPALMASTSVEQFNDYSEVLNQTTRRLNRLSGILTQQYNPTLLKRTESSIKEIRLAIDELLKEAVSDEVNLNRLRDQLDEVKNRLKLTLVSHYPDHRVMEDKIPSEVRDAIMQQAENVNFNEVKVLCLVNPDSYGEELPKRYNAFLAMDIGEKSFLTTHSEDNTYTNSQVPAIGTIEALESFYKTYKDFSKSYTVKDSSDLLNKVEKSVTEMSNFMMSKYATTTNIVDNTVKTQERMTPFLETEPFTVLRYTLDFPYNYTKGITDEKEKIKVMRHITNLIDEPFDMILRVLERCILDNPDIVESNANLKQFAETEDNLRYLNTGAAGLTLFSEKIIHLPNARFKLNETKRREMNVKILGMLSTFIDHGKFDAGVLDDLTTAILRILNDFVETTTVNSSVDPKEILDTLSDIQNVVLPFLNTFKSHVTATATSLTAIYTESRAASIKYIYDSARLYH